MNIERVADGYRRPVRCRYLFGADGPRSFVRERLGLDYVGETGVIRGFMGGRMHALYVRCPSFYEISRHAPAWMNGAFNADRAGVHGCSRRVQTSNRPQARENA